MREPEAMARVAREIDAVVRQRGYFIPADQRADVAQDAHLSLWEECARPGFAVRDGSLPFVRTIAHRRCVDWMRKHRPSAPLDPEMPDGNPRPDTHYLAREEARLGLLVLQGLREPCRELLRLHTVEGKGYTEIAALLGRSEGALRTQMCECLKQARATLARLQGQPPTERKRP
jgi:RNA polymerase sigma factor (sigma-70 family)